VPTFTNATIQWQIRFSHHKEKRMIVELGKVSQQTKGLGEAGQELPAFPTTQPKH
jgi:hypothetical protein